SQGLDLFDLGPNRVQEVLFENARFCGAFVAMVSVDIPAAKNQIIKGRERNEIMDLLDPALGAFPEPYRSKLGEGSHRLGDLLLDRFNARDARCTAGAKPRKQDAQLAEWHLN